MRKNLLWTQTVNIYKGFSKSCCTFLFSGSHWGEANLRVLETQQLVTWCVSTLMILILHSVCELLCSREHSCAIFRFHQGKSHIFDTYLMGRMCVRCSKFTQDNALSQWSICKYIQMERNVQDRLDKCKSCTGFTMPLIVNQQWETARNQELWFSRTDVTITETTINKTLLRARIFNSGQKPWVSQGLCKIGVQKTDRRS